MGQGGFQALARTHLVSARTRRRANGLSLPELNLSGAQSVVGGGTLTRAASGIVFYDDFNRADGSLGGSWVTDAGTWAISSNQATNSSGTNFDRCRNTGVSLTAGVYEARMKAVSGTNYCGLRWLAPSASDDFHFLAAGNNTDEHFARAAASDVNLGTLTATMDTNFHVWKVVYSGTRQHVFLFDHATGVLGSFAVPFTPTTGPTAAGAVGFISYGGAAIYDWVLVSSGRFITVTGLTGTQAFRLFNSVGGTIGSSAAQSSGSATLDISTLVDGLVTGYIEVHPDTSFAAMQARYPAVSGNATDICGGDSYTFA